jgi:hypothetical protein
VYDSFDAEGRWVEKAQRVRAVAHDELFAVRRESPALAGISERVDERQRRRIVDVRDPFLPGKLVEPPTEKCEALAETIWCERVTCQHAARPEIDAADL